MTNYMLERMMPQVRRTRTAKNPPGPNSPKKLARLLRRRDNIERRIGQLERDFEAAGSMEAELRINDEIRRQRIYLLRIDDRLAGTTRG